MINSDYVAWLLSIFADYIIWPDKVQKVFQMETKRHFVLGKLPFKTLQVLFYVIYCDFISSPLLVCFDNDKS